MKKSRFWTILAGVILTLLVAAVYYYVELPAINIHAPGFWKFIIVVLVVLVVVNLLLGAARPEVEISGGRVHAFHGIKFNYKSKSAQIRSKILMGITAAVVVIFVIGALLSSPIINAKKYQQLMTVDTRTFTEDIHPVSYDQIPILDKDSAATIGNRVMGTMVDMVSQFEVSDMYTQINYQNKPVRVAPLEYGSLIKWFTNHSDGIPAYIKIDMTTQEAECVRLDQGIQYSTSDHFGRNIYRYLRFAYPTYIFDDINFEIDEDGTPYWVCPVKQYNIGLFGGVTIGRVVLVNAVTGEMEDYVVDQAPQWIDKVYSAEMLIDLYDYNGQLKNGYLNSVLSQKGCLQTTDGYNYIALEDDVWVYTGITSVGQDKSNVGFVLMNQRTMETRYYEISGAEENSAMSSAEGKVQHLGYSATFPFLLNVGGEPTYFMALKDSAGLVKQYAMLNIEKYQTVATGDTVAECEKAYVSMMADNGITVPQEKAQQSVTGTIAKITQTVIGGNSHFLIMLDGSDEIYDVSVADFISVIRYNIGDTVTFAYEQGDGCQTVIDLK